MQNTSTETNNTNNTNPTNFPETTATVTATATGTGTSITTKPYHQPISTITEGTNESEDQETEQISKTPEAIRTQNFSFASTYPYAPGRHSNTNSHYNNFYNNFISSSHPVLVSNSSSHFQPISNSFSVLHNNSHFDNVRYSNDLHENYRYATLADKPNAIVRPIRRAEQQQPPQSAALPPTSRQSQLFRLHHVSQDGQHPTQDSGGGGGGGGGDGGGGRDQGYNEEGTKENIPITNVAPRTFFSRSVHEVTSFAEQLQQKLRFLQPEEAYGHGQIHPLDPLNQRPRFVTTVPTGIFLPPAKELEYLPASVFRRHVYAYSSYPYVQNTYNYNSNNDMRYYNRSSVNPKLTKDRVRTLTATTATNVPMHNFDKDMRINATRMNGHIRTGMGVIPAQSQSQAQATTTTAPPMMVSAAQSQPSTSTTMSSATSQATVLAGELHITKEQFQQQLQQRRDDTRKVIPPMEPYKNVMYEKRVIKGSNFGNQAMITEVDPFDKAAELRRRNMLRKRSLQCRNQRNVLGTPPPVKGRKHEDVQTDKYLEKLVQRPPEFNVETQTDLFLEKPPIPPFIHAKIGVDVATEIGEGELFHFDAEAQPIIDVLVDACIEQSMLEVAHELELDALRKKQEEYLAQREAELAELRRLEAEELRLQAEKERRLRQDAIAKELDEEMQKSVTAAKLLQGHIASLVPEVLENIEPASDAVKKEQLMKNICPWLSAEVAEEVGHIVDSREILTAIIKEIITQRAEIYAGYKEISEAEKIVSICEEDCDLEQRVECCQCETDTEYEECPREPTPPDSEAKIASLRSPKK